MPESYPQDVIEDLVDRKLSWDQLREMMTSFKDRDRFEKYIIVVQERVDWDDPVILPYAEHLYVVAKPGDRWVIKCDCGHEFCEYDENWKLHALINVRENEEEIREIYPEGMGPDTDWQELREYICPTCNTLLEVETCMPWDPPVHTFEPDIETFYEDWIEKPIPRAGDG